MNFGIRSPDRPFGVVRTRGRGQNHRMGRKHDPAKQDPAKPLKISVKITGKVAVALSQLADEDDVKLTAFVTDAVRDKLRSMGWFPPKPSAPSS